MLKSLDINGFTVFSPLTQFSFSPGLNVIIGENGLGKSHLLKLAYSAAYVCNKYKQQANISKQQLQRDIAQKLVGVFRPDYLGRLARRKPGRNRCEIDVRFLNNTCDYRFSFASKSREEVVVESCMSRSISQPAIFLPTMEVISIFPGFASLYRDKHLSFDETYYDLCLALERSLNKGARYESIRRFLDPIEDVLQGKTYCENGRFYLALPGKGNMEIPLIAEGHRKLAALAYLIANGSISEGSMLFWDEPETNLNPVLMRQLAQILVLLSQQGIQIFITSHSLFFVKELDLVTQSQAVPPESCRWFALSKTSEDQDICLSSGSVLEDVDPIRSLDVELEQSQRLNFTRR